MHLKTAIVGTVLVFGGAISYMLLLDNAWIRSTTLPNIVLIVVGMALCGWAIVKKPGKITLACGVLGGLGGLAFIFAMFVAFSLPPPPDATGLDAAATSFSLPNQDGRQVSLSSFRGKGPVLLVFYRGHW